MFGILFCEYADKEIDRLKKIKFFSLTVVNILSFLILLIFFSRYVNLKNLNMKIKFSISVLITFFVFGCSNQEDFSNLISEPEIVTGLNLKSSYILGQNIEFHVFDQNQNDVSEISIFFVDGLEISDNHITHYEIGNHSVYAEYTINGQIYITEEIDYSVVNPVNKVLMEDFTGTWCGYCPLLN